MEPNRAAVGVGGVSGATAATGWPSQAAPARSAVSGLWWIAPIVFGLLGGIVAWAVNRGRDPSTARNMLIVGIISGVLGYILLSTAHFR
jgi:hypothetical protein